MSGIVYRHHWCAPINRTKGQGQTNYIAVFAVKTQSVTIAIHIWLWLPTSKDKLRVFIKYDNAFSFSKHAYFQWLFWFSFVLIWGVNAQIVTLICFWMGKGCESSSPILFCLMASLPQTASVCVCLCVWFWVLWDVESTPVSRGLPPPQPPIPC